MKSQSSFVRCRTTGVGICTDGIYKVVAQWAKAAGIHVDVQGLHGLQATAGDQCAGA